MKVIEELTTILGKRLKLGSSTKVGSKEKNNFLCALNYIDE